MPEEIKKKRKKRRKKRKVIVDEPQLEGRFINQKSVTIHKKLSHTRNKYFTVNKEPNHTAMQNLSGTAYKMYIYLCENRDGFAFLLSNQRFSLATGVSTRMYQSAKQELLEKNYLQENADGDYEFYADPTGYDKIDS